MAGDWTRDELERDFIGKIKPITIPVGQRIAGKTRVLALREMEKLLRAARRIAQGECACRKRLKQCIQPMDGCLSLDQGADRAIAGGAREISLAEALAALERTSKAGLVHMAYVFGDNDKPGQICSCCSCCCHSLSALVRFGYQEHVTFSKLIAKQAADQCTGCGACVERCQFKARTLSKRRFSFDDKMCAGCGVCVPACAVGAIALVARPAD